jgi:hypothetical protein
VSVRWTRREKAVATVLTLLPVMIIVLGGLTLFVARAPVTSDSPAVPVESGIVTAPPTSP